MSSHGHSHGGDTSSHGHSHGDEAGHGHSHGGGDSCSSRSHASSPAASSHGHSHGGDSSAHGASCGHAHASSSASSHGHSHGGDEHGGAQDSKLTEGENQWMKPEWKEINTQLMELYMTQYRGMLEAREKQEATADAASAVVPIGTAGLFHHVKRGTAEASRIAIESEGADIRAVDESGYGPLHYAVRRPNVDIVKLLMEHGADLNLRSSNDMGETPLTMAVEGGDLEICHHLVKSGARIDLTNAHGFTPLHYAVIHQRLLIAVFLLQNGAQLNVIDEQGQTPTHWACYKQNSTVLSHLLRFRPDLLVRDKRGMLPLHWAAAVGDITCTRTLLMHRRDRSVLSVLSFNGFTPLDFAKHNGHKDVQALLEAYSLPPNASFLTRHWINMRNTNAFGYFGPGVFLPMFWAAFALCHVYIALMISIFVFDFVKKNYRSATVSPMLVGIFVWSYAHCALVFFVQILPNLPEEQFTTVAVFVVVNLLLMWNYYHLFWNDAGALSHGASDVIDFLHEVRDGASPDNYCPTCIIRKPARSKHCAECNTCVQRMDHHCPWLNNCVGVKNHVRFYVFVGNHLLAQLIFLRICVAYFVSLDVTSITDENFGLQLLVSEFYNVRPYLLILMLWHILNGTWLFALFMQHTLQIGVNITTNEFWKRKKYEHFRTERGGYSNPFSLGPLGNFVDFFVDPPHVRQQRYEHQFRRRMEDVKRWKAAKQALLTSVTTTELSVGSSALVDSTSSLVPHVGHSASAASAASQYGSSGTGATGSDELDDNSYRINLADIKIM